MIEELEAEAVSQMVTSHQLLAKQLRGGRKTKKIQGADISTAIPALAQAVSFNEAACFGWLKTDPKKQGATPLFR